MNLHLAKIEPFCATDTQKELLKKIKKIQKFRIRRFSDSYLLDGLLFSFYVEEKFEPVMLYYDEIISLPFDESFPCGMIFGIFCLFFILIRYVPKRKKRRFSRATKRFPVIRYQPSLRMRSFFLPTFLKISFL